MAPNAPSLSPKTTLTDRALNRALLARQGLLEPLRHRGAAEAVRSVLSLQAQHPEWPPVALASRVTSRAAANLRTALEARELVRASLMRITIHVVHVDDLPAMLAACRPMRLQQLRLILREDPEDGALARRIRAAHPAVTAALAEGPQPQREMERILAAESGIDEATLLGRFLWRHYIAFVPTVHVPWDGEGYGRSRYTTVAAWLGHATPELDTDVATTRLGERYLEAFGPASVTDFTQYVGRVGGIRRWRAALDAVGDRLVRYRGEDGRELLDVADAARPEPDTDAPPRLLARWDSVLLSHEPSRRERIIAAEHKPLVFTKNADVLPTFTVDGFVAGTWQLERAGDRARIRLRPFGRLAATDREALSEEADRVMRRALPDAAGHDVELLPPGA
jgi:hypothetical protein